MSRLVDHTSILKSVDALVYFVHYACLVISVGLIVHLLLQGGALAEVCLARLLKNMVLSCLVRVNHSIDSLLRLLAANVEELLIFVS